jgi:putative membrane protein
MTRVYIWLTGLFAALGTALPAWADAIREGYNYAHGPMWHGGWYGMVLGPVMMIAVVAAVVAVVVLLLRWLGGTGHAAAPGPQAPPGKTPLDILKERFARGEIDKAEFEDRRQVLGE